MPKTNSNYLDILRLEHCTFGPEFQFLSDNQDIRHIKESLGEIANEFDSFFAKIGDGDYQEVWGIYGIIPYTSKNAYQIL